eukprot:Opistho-2@49318
MVKAGVMDEAMTAQSDEFVTSATDAIEIRLLSSASDLEDDELAFHPEFTHQLFGENEAIFGYKAPSVKLFYGAGSLLTHLSLDYKKKISATDDAQPDDVIKIIGEKIPQGFTSNVDVFLSKLAAEEAKFKPIGNLVHSYTDPEDKNTTFNVYKSNADTPRPRDYHARLQLFAMWLIETANFIDLEDPQWRVYLIFRHTRDPSNSKNDRHVVLGFSTVYEYFSFPDLVRLRVSQHVILPPYQGAGHGTELLRAIMLDARRSSEVFDVTVEEPNEAFTRMRDALDAAELMRVPEFTPPPPTWDDRLAKIARERLKITKKQTRRVYEIIRLLLTNVGNPDEYRQYRLQIKK